jgi:hypothetical protein
VSLRKDFTIIQGSSFSEKIRWETTPYIYKAIAAIDKTAPARITTVDPHNIPDGWRVAIVSVKGMTEINATATPPKEKDFKESTLINGSVIELNTVNAADYRAYVSGGYVQYYTPKDLAGYVGRLTIKTKVGGTELLALTTANGGIEVNATDKYIEIIISAADTESIDWKKGVYDLEMESPTGEVTSLLNGAFTVTKEVTT